MTTTSEKKQTVVIGTRESPLAMVQAKQVQQLLSHLHPHLVFDILGMTTTGDQILDKRLAEVGGKALFTKELEKALEEKQADLLVHSLKDMTTDTCSTRLLAAIMKREDPRDVVLMSPKYASHTLSSLPPGSVVGTSSTRRTALIRHLYPHLQVSSVRGNLNTRYDVGLTLVCVNWMTQTLPLPV
jgi:hydroxymethylbilane synthase